MFPPGRKQKVQKPRGRDSVAHNRSRRRWTAGPREASSEDKGGEAGQREISASGMDGPLQEAEVAVWECNCACGGRRRGPVI